MEPRTALFPAIPAGGLLRLILLFLVTFVVYSPALNRVWSSDQLAYLAELNGSDSLGSGLAHVDYSASRQYNKGDEISFRPLLFVWLAVMNALFSYHHIGWNIATLALHALVAFQLCRLLEDIRPSPLAPAAAALFLVMKPLVELPAWNHLGGYMLAWLCFTIAARALLRITRPDGSSRGSWLAYVVSLTAGCLLHEAMVPISLVAALALLATDWRLRRRLPVSRIAAVILPAAVFVSLYAFHLLQVERISYVGRSDELAVFDLKRQEKFIRTTAAALARWSQEMAIPSAIHLSVTPFDRLRKNFTPSLSNPADAFNLMLSLGALALIASTVSGAQLKRAGPMIALFSGALVAYAGALSFGRSVYEIRVIAYYPYFFCLAAIALLYALIDFEKARSWLTPAAWAVALALLASHTIEMRTVVSEIRRANHQASIYLSEIEKFVDWRKSETGFTFAIAGASPDVDPQFRLNFGYPDTATTVRNWRVTEIVFRKYYDADHPRHVIEWTGAAIRIQPTFWAAQGWVAGARSGLPTYRTDNGKF